jgi:hypothetical protein
MDIDKVPTKELEAVLEDSRQRIIILKNLTREIVKELERRRPHAIAPGGIESAEQFGKF